MRPGYAAGEVEAVLLVAFAPVGGDLRDSAVDRVLDFFHADEFGLELDVFGREGLDFCVVLEELFGLLREADELAGLFHVCEQYVVGVEVLEGRDEGGPARVVLRDRADVRAGESKLV